MPRRLQHHSPDHRTEISHTEPPLKESPGSFFRSRPAFVSLFASCLLTKRIQRRLDDPLSIGLEKLHTDGVAGFAEGLAISDSSDRVKVSGARSESQPVVGVPAPDADDTSAACADVFGERALDSRGGFVPRKQHRDFHRNAFVTAVEGKLFWHASPSG